MTEGIEPVAGEVAVAERKNRMAVTAFVLTLLPLCGVTSLIGLILGVVSLSRISESGGRLKGKGLALAAVIIGALGIVLLPVIFVLAGMLLPALARAREEARRAACKNNVSQIGKALFSYACDHNDQYPTTGTPGDSAASLALLHPQYLSDIRVFMCPSAAGAGQRRAMRGPLTEADCSYTYDNTVTMEDASADTILLWDKSPENHRNGRNVLFVDCHVKWMSEEEFQGKLAEQKARAVEPRAP